MRRLDVSDESCCLYVSWALESNLDQKAQGEQEEAGRNDSPKENRRRILSQTSRLVPVRISQAAYEAVPLVYMGFACT